jgi:chromosome segregation ATPase
MIGVAETCSLLLPPPVSYPSALIQILDADEHERISSSLNSALCNEIVIAQSYEALYSLLFPALVEAEAEAQMANTVGQQYLTAWREMHNERDSLVEEREALRTQTEEMRLDKCGLESRLNQTQDDHRTVQRKAADDLRKEQETVQLLNSRLHQATLTEEGLRSEIETYGVLPLSCQELLADNKNRLTSELTEAERFQDAFYTLKDQVDSLSARNDLAQGEAEKLSKLNAQILGHGNPAQRIMYVDKIRQELSQCKQVSCVFRT